ncbi:MAG: helix-turn-helix domain-containing protein [Tissierellia bacterium]|nr:helix-turn-helix domain-containing protein [Tissierellia bacterium]
MNLIAEKNLVRDFIATLEIHSEELEKDFFDTKEREYSTTEEAYMKAILSYQKDLEDLRLPISHFVSKGFNMYTSLYAYYKMNHPLDTFDAFTTQLEALKQEDIRAMLSIGLGLEEDFSVAELNETDLSPEGKWCILSLLGDFERTKKQLLSIYTKTAQLYRKHYHGLEKEFPSLIECKCQKLSTNQEKILQKFYYDFLPQSPEPSEIYILPMNVNRVSIDMSLYGEKTCFFSMGLFLWDNILAKEGSEAVDERQCLDILKLLADPTRFGILKMIKGGITTNKVLAAIFSITSAGVTYQLKTLAEHDLIQTNEGTGKYEVNDALIQRVFDALQKDLKLSEKS